MSLREYIRKRDFQKSAEPEGARAARGGSRFVIQKHAASHLHYDFRLEVDGVLKSWAVPKGVPYTRGEKRLAVQVEDHPAAYIDFEGTIPAGQYGGGTVMVWDRGTFSTNGESASQGLKAGKLHFTLTGKKLRGEWYLVRLRDGKQWLLIKSGESFKPVSARQDDLSARSGKTMKQLGNNGAVWESKPKAEAQEKHLSPTLSPSAAPTRRGRGIGARSGKTMKQLGRNGAVWESKPKAEAQEKHLSPALSPSAAPTRSGRKMGAGTKRNGHFTPAHSPSASPMRSGRKSGGRTVTFIEPMKARLAEAAPATRDWLYEIKFDGYRALAFKDGTQVTLLSRNEKDLGGEFPELVDAIAGLEARQLVMDGEIVALDPKGVSSFQLLQGFEIGEERPPIYFYAFDLLQLDGKDLRRQTVIQRKEQLETVLENAPAPLRFSASLGEDAQKLLRRAARLGLEGLIGKRKESVYEAGQRSGAWIKLKIVKEQELVIGGYSDPEGSREYFGALLVGVYEGKKLKFCGKVGTGFDSRLLENLHGRLATLAQRDCPFVNLPETHGSRYSPGLTAREMRKCHWVAPRLVGQIKFSEWTQDGKLRQPVFLGLREDKDAAEVVRENPK